MPNDKPARESGALAKLGLEAVIQSRIATARDALDQKLAELERRVRVLRPRNLLANPWLVVSLAVFVGAGVGLVRSYPHVRRTLMVASGAMVRRLINETVHAKLNSYLASAITQNPRRNDASLH